MEAPTLKVNMLNVETNMTELQRRINEYHSKFATFLQKNDLATIDCDNAMIVETELYDRLPDEGYNEMVEFLKKEMDPFEMPSENPLDDTLAACAAQLINYCNNTLLDRLEQLLAQLASFVPLEADERRQLVSVWHEDNAEARRNLNLSARMSIVTLTLLLICNTEKILKSVHHFVTLIRKSDPSDGKMKTAIVALVRRVLT